VKGKIVATRGRGRGLPATVRGGARAGPTPALAGAPGQAYRKAILNQGEGPA